MATTATATPPVQKNPEDVRAAAMAVLRLADERTEKGATVAKHRSPLPVQSPVAKRSSTGMMGMGMGMRQGGGAASQNNEKRASFNLLSWGKKQMDDMKEQMNKMDEKFLAMQFEQEEKIKKAYDKTTSEWSGKLSTPKKNQNLRATASTPVDKNRNLRATPETPSTPLAAVIKETVVKDLELAKEEVQTTMSRFRHSFSGFAQKLVAPQPPQPKEPPSVDEQIVEELEQLHELMTLCHTLLAEKNDLINQIDYEPDPRLPHTIKKLEASLGRMDQLMEAGIDGQFQDDTTQICVSTYERLILTLEKCNSPLVKSNAFAFTKDLEGDSEFDETTPDKPAAAAAAESSVSSKPAAEEAAATTTEDKPAETTTTTSPDLALDAMDADMDIDLAAFEIGSDDEDDIILGDNLEKKKKSDDKVNESTDDDFIKDMNMFE
eukprot:CAMPEP_0113655078 /NCGR_PEP_ID=MMETSP0017_2-20120614/29501_1 /TAXON_ID=2856 /ORGANISM="Cylindrotheca closterium" /LENGTH=434 /DNA_ID=CAMNT_0000568275 /DNA_START=6 /DNA_END=1311 /DNA_ORIENTATION=+ /assembly_acc=CAM_ASM_000147